MRRKDKTMKFSNIVVTISNYATPDLESELEYYGDKGYKLVAVQMAKNKYGAEVMYLFFTREE